MKKFLMALIATMLVVAISGLSIGCNKDQKPDIPPEESVQPDTGEDSGNTENPEKPEEKPVGPEVVLRVPAKEALNKNYELLNLKDLYVIKDGDFSIVGKVFKDVKIGDLVKAVISNPDDIPVAITVKPIDFYSDGNWYIGEAPNNEKMTTVVNAIFNYEIGGGKALDLSEEDLARYGNQTVLNCIIGQFSQNGTDSFIDVIKNSLPENTKILFNKLSSITVRELYEETKPDSTHEYINNLKKEISITTIINSAFEIVKIIPNNPYKGDFSALNNLLNEVFTGTLDSIKINKDVNFGTLISAVKPLFGSKSKVVDAAIDEIAKLYKNITVSNLKKGTENLAVQDVLFAISNVLKTTTEDKAQIDKIDYWFSDARRYVFSGTLGRIEINEAKRDVLENLVKQILDELNKGNDNTLASEKIATLIIKSNNLRNELSDATVNAQDTIAKYIKDLAGYVEESQITEEATAFINDLSKYFADLHNKQKADIDALVKKYSGKTVAELDAYLNGYITDFLNSIDQKLGNMLEQMSIKDAVLYVTNPVEFIDFLYIKYLKSDLEKNGEMTFGEYDKTYLNGFFTSILPKNYSDILNKKVKDVQVMIESTIAVSKDYFTKLKGVSINGPISEIDNLFFAGAVREILKTHNKENLLDYTLNDYISLSKPEKSQELENELMDLKLSAITDILKVIKTNADSIINGIAGNQAA